MKYGLLIFLIAWVTGCASQPKVPRQTLRFHEQVTGNLPVDYAQPVTIPSTRQKMLINPEPTLTEADVQAAKLTPTIGGDAVLLKFDTHGANVLAEMTTRLRGQSVVVFVNDRPVASLLVEHANATGQLLLIGDLTDEQNKLLVDSLNKSTKGQRQGGASTPEP